MAVARGFGQASKQRAYLRGFNREARDRGLDLGSAHCPYGILDDPTLNADAAYELGRADARDAARGRVAS